MKKVLAAVLGLFLVPLAVVIAMSGSQQLQQACGPSSPVQAGPGAGGGLTSPGTEGQPGGRAAVAGDPQARGAQAGTGTQLGALPVVRNAQPGGPVTGAVRTAVANLPERAKSGRGRSIRAIAATDPDFIALNEVASSGARQLAGYVHGYGAYKDPVSAPGQVGYDQSLETAVMWNASRWHLLDAGRFEFVEHDHLMYSGRAKVWNRYATWAILSRASDGAQVVVIAAHQMTNPRTSPTPAAYTGPSRFSLYADGMKRLRALIEDLAAYGPVLMAGDMNSHPGDGGWAAAAQMAQSGFGFTKDSAILYQFFPHGTRATGRRLVRVDSDHPFALITSINLHGAGANDTSGTPPPSGQDPGGTSGQVTTATLLGAGCCGGSGGGGTANLLPAADTAGAPSTVPGFSAEQLQDAAAVVAAGKALNVPPRGIAIGLMTAYGESKLKNIDYGDRDSIGIFQQRDNGAWGTTADRMNPTTAAANFFKKLLQVPGWESMMPTLAAHAVQINADPFYYTPYWATGLKLQAALQGVTAAQLANPTAMDCPPASGTGTSAIAFTASGTPYVGEFDPAQLMARAQAFVQAGTSDPFFHTVNGSWYRKCQHFVANLSGRAKSGYSTAAEGWAHFVSTGAAHPATGPDGQSPPVGAWLYFRGTSASGHVTVYLGNGMSASTDLPTSGRVGIVPADAPVTQWHQTYLGWAAPWAAPGSGSRAA